MKKKKIIKIVFSVLLFIIFLILGLFFLFKSNIDKEITQSINNNIIENFEQRQEEYKVPKIQSQITEVESNIEIKNNMLGYVISEDLKLKEPIFDNPTEKNLMNGLTVGKEGFTLEQQNVVLAGHRILGVNKRFWNLPNAKNGMIVKVYTKEKIYTYKIYNKFIVKDTDTYILEQNENKDKMLTMFTCTNYSNRKQEFQDRLVVLAKLENEQVRKK